jgi:hypothetical protein
MGTFTLVLKVTTYFFVGGGGMFNVFVNSYRRSLAQLLGEGCTQGSQISIRSFSCKTHQRYVKQFLIPYGNNGRLSAGVQIFASFSESLIYFLYQTLLVDVGVDSFAGGGKIRHFSELSARTAAIAASILIASGLSHQAPRCDPEAFLF